MRRLLAILILVIAPTVSARAQTLSTRDVIELSKAGLGEEVLLALIEVNRSIFPVDRDTMKSLKDGGVTPAVIVAMVRSGREQVEPPPPIPQRDAVMPQDVTTDVPTSRERELERELELAKDREFEREMERNRAERRAFQYVVPVAVPVYVPVPVRPRPPVKPAAPVYWGWDGQRRPDSWDPAPVRDKRDTGNPNDARVPLGTLVPRGPGGGN